MAAADTPRKINAILVTAPFGLSGSPLLCGDELNPKSLKFNSFRILPGPGAPHPSEYVASRVDAHGITLGGKNLRIANGAVGLSV